MVQPKIGRKPKPKSIAPVAGAEIPARTTEGKIEPPILTANPYIPEKPQAPIPPMFEMNDQGVLVRAGNISPSPASKRTFPGLIPDPENPNRLLRAQEPVLVEGKIPKPNELLKNPSAETLNRFALSRGQSDMGQWGTYYPGVFRGIFDSKGNLYISDANSSVHHDMFNALNPSQSQKKIRNRMETKSFYLSQKDKTIQPGDQVLPMDFPEWFRSIKKVLPKIKDAMGVNPTINERSPRALEGFDALSSAEKQEFMDTFLPTDVETWDGYRANFINTVKNHMRSKLYVQARDDFWRKKESK